MELRPIDCYAEPTNEEIDEELQARPIDADRYVARQLASIRILCLRKEANPDAYLQPFPVDDDEYRRYLGGNGWRTLSRSILEGARHICACCGGRATVIHHRDYRPRVLRGEDASALVPLCRHCHRRIHFRGSIQRSWNECEAILASLVEAAKQPHPHPAQLL